MTNLFNINPWKLKIIVCLMFLLAAKDSKTQTKHEKQILSPLKLTSPSDSLQYTLGAFLGQWIIKNGFTVTNPDLFRKGIDDVLLNKNLLVNSATVSARLDSYQKRLISERSSQQEKLLFENVKGKPGVGMLPSGVAYMVAKAGTGIKPRASDSVAFHVKGYLPDGKLFEDTYAKKNILKGKPSTFISGINEILQIMPVGSTWRVFIPSALGYAERGLPGLVPAYSALIFDVELVSVIDALK